MRNIQPFVTKSTFFLFTFVLLLILSETVISQTMSSLGGVTPAGLRRGTENVNLFNGGVNASIPLLTVGGRGKVSYTIYARADSKKWVASKTRSTYGCTVGESDLCYFWTANAYTTDYLESISGGLQLVLEPKFEFGTVHWRSVSSTLAGTQTTGYYYEKTHSTIVFKGQNGAEVTLYDDKTGGPGHLYYPQNPGAEIHFNRGKIFTAKDGSEMTFISDSDVTDDNSVNNSELMPVKSNTYQVSGYLKLKNGIVCRVVDSRIDWMQDSNGNRMVFSYNTPTGISRSLVKVTDSNGRDINFSHGQESQITYQGFNGATRTIKIKRDTIGNRFRPSPSYSVGNIFPEMSSGGGVGAPLAEQATATITLPDSRKYEFYYNEYGEIARMELPTGAAVEYNYGKGDVTTSGYSSYASGQVGDVVNNSNSGNFLLYIYRRVKEMREYANGGNVVTLKTNYSESSNGLAFGQGGTTIVTEKQSDPSSVVLAKTSHHFNGSATVSLSNTQPIDDLPNLLENKEIITDQLAVNDLVLARNEFTWSTGCGVRDTTNCGGELAWAPYLKNTTSKIFDSSSGQYKISKQEFNVDKYNNVTDIYEYDFSSGSLTGTTNAFLRRTHTDYVTDVNYTANTGSRFRGLPSGSWISSDAAGYNKAAKTEFKYDETALTSRSNVIGWINPTSAYRGNLTKTRNWLKYDNEPEVWLETKAEYDVLGNVVKTIDAKNHASTIIYEDNFGSPDGEARTTTNPSYVNDQNATVNPLGGLKTYAFPTSAFNALLWRTAYSQFDYFTGSPVDVEDLNGVDDENLNGVVSSSFYNDPLDRPTQSIFANNLPTLRRQTTTVYDDVIERKITTTSDLNEFDDKKLKSEILYDGLGRTIESRNYEGSATDYISTLTEYDALDRVKRVSNPYRPTAGEAQYWTESKYDALGRVYQVIMQDNSVVSTSYSGNAVTVTDQAGKTRRSISNALGQLMRVDEPNALNNLGSITAPTQATYYSYDVLGNMVKVEQGSQARYFKYDSLGRLLRVRQPEQDVNTNLDTTGYPNNNQWTAGFTYDKNGNVLTTTDSKNTIITNNNYDALNRPQTRTYSDGTPTITFTYDDPNVAYSRGKLTKVANSISISETAEFDILNRPKIYRQTTDGQTYQSSYQYNFMGALEQETYPSGRTVKNEFDANGNLSKISGKKIVEKTFAEGFTYTSAKAIKELHLGNGLWEAAKFNSRLQVTELGLGVTTANLNKWKVNYDYGEIDPYEVYHPTKNTGNIARQTISFDGLAAPFIQIYRYDKLDRLELAKETSNNQLTWNQSFMYDRYGNRTSLGQSYGPPAIPQPTIQLTKNRFNPGQGYGYDANGNVITDPTNGGRTFTFDGDNKQTEVRDVYNVLIGKYFYDGEGKRVKKQTYDQYGQVKETTVFVYSGSKLVAEYSDAPPPTNPTTSYVMTDILGSVRAISDSSGNITSRRDFMPFGEELPSDGTYRTTAQKYPSTNDKIKQKFTGYQKDEETNLDFAEARMYQSGHGRFTAVDPLLASGKSANPQTFNRYAYVLNNPLVFTDPSGLQVGDYRGNVYANADNTAFSNTKQDGYTLYEGGRRTVNATDGWTYAIRKGGWTQVGKTDPNIVDIVAQGVSDTVLGGGGTLYNGLAGTVNATNWVANSLPNFSGTGDRFGYLPYYEPRTSGEASASLATTFLSFYAGGVSTGRNPFFAGFSTEVGGGGRTVFSGHGAYEVIGNGARYPIGSGILTVPEGTSVTTYSRFGQALPNSIGNAIETNSVSAGTFSRTYSSGMRMPNYTLGPIDRSWVQGNPVLVTQPTRLSELLQPNMGNCHFAACTSISNPR